MCQITPQYWILSDYWLEFSVGWLYKIISTPDFYNLYFILFHFISFYANILHKILTNNHINFNSVE